MFSEIIKRLNVFILLVLWGLNSNLFGYGNTLNKDFLADAPWRVSSLTQNIPIMVYIKDADQDGLTLKRIRIKNNSDGSYLVNHDYDPTDFAIDYSPYIYVFENITAETFGITSVGSAADFTVEIEYSDNIIFGGTFKQRLQVFVGNSLPSIPYWYPGDTHFHSDFTDSPLEFGAGLFYTGNSNPDHNGYTSAKGDLILRRMGKAVGLKWVTVTDHSCDFGDDVFDDDTAKDVQIEQAKTQWNNMATICRSNPINDFVIIPAEEVTVDHDGRKHILAYQTNSYIDGPELEALGVVDVTDRIDDNLETLYNALINVSTSNGFMYAAHPRITVENLGKIVMSAWGDYLIESLGNYSSFKGLELWNTRITKDEKEMDVLIRIDPFPWSYNSNWDYRLDEGIKQWDRVLLSNLNKTTLQKTYISGGSDAHGDFNYETNFDLDDLKYKLKDNAFGNVRTYVYTKDGLSEQNVLGALGNGHSVVTDGPLVIFGIDQDSDGDLNSTSDIIIGDDCEKEIGSNVFFTVKWDSSSSYRDISDGRIDELVFKYGCSTWGAPKEKLLSVQSLNDVTAWVLEGDMKPSTTSTYYYRVEARVKDDNGNVIYRAYTNPIWIRWIESSNNWISVTDPNSGITWVKGNIEHIGYDTNEVSNVKILLYKGTSLVRAIEDSIAASGSYNWRVPTDLQDGTDYKIRIEDTTNPQIYDASGTFSISTTSPDPYILVTTPAIGTVWVQGNLGRIKYITTAVGNVNILLYKGSSLSRTIASDTSNTGSYSWVVPTDLIAGDDYKIKVEDASNTQVSYTTSVFTINEPEEHPTIEIDTITLSFYTDPGVNPASKTFQVRNSGPGTLYFTASFQPNDPADGQFVTLSPETDGSTGEWVTVTAIVDCDHFSAGSYWGYIFITDPNATNVSEHITVTLTVSDSSNRPEISGNPTRTNFNTYLGSNPEPQFIQIWNSGGGTLNYTLTHNADWLEIIPSSGTSTGEIDDIQLIVNSENLAAGIYETAILVEDPDAKPTGHQMYAKLFVQESPPSSEYITISDHDYSEYYPQTAKGNNSFLTVWQDKRLDEHNRYAIYGARLNYNGDVLDPDGIFLKSSSSASFYHPGAAFNGEKYLVVWSVSILPYEIQGRFIDEDGNVGDVLSLGTGADDQELEFGTSNFFLMWGEDVGDEDHLYGKILDENANIVSSQITVADDMDVRDFKVRYFNGKFFAFWVYRDSNYQYSVCLKRISEDGAILDSSDITLVPPTTDTLYLTDIVATDNDVFAFVYRQGAEGSIFRIDADGNFNAETRAVGLGDQFCFDNDTQRINQFSLDETNKKLQIQRLDSNGNPIDSTPFPVLSYSSDVFRIRKAIYFGFGKNLVVFNEIRNDYGVFGTIYQFPSDSLNFVSPEEGEIWVRGTSHDIVWQTAGIIENVTLELLKNNNYELTIAENIENLDYHTWEVPYDLNPDVDYSIRIKDETGTITSVSSLFTISADTPPELSITHPAHGDNVSGSVNIDTEVTDDIGINRVEFYIDNIVKSTKFNEPFSWQWDTLEFSNGDHIIKIIAYDTSEQYTEAAVTVTVNNIVINPVLSVSPTSWNAPPEGGTSGEISVTNSGSGGAFTYSLTENIEWLQLSHEEGSTPGTFTITALANDTGTSRSAEVTVTADGVEGSPQTINVTQEALSQEPVYRFWYDGKPSHSSISGGGFGYATSTDGVNITRHPDNPILTTGGGGTFNEFESSSPHVVYDGSLYHMFFIGRKDEGDTRVYKIGYATSSDGVQWDFYAQNPIQLDSGNIDSIGPILYLNGYSKMWYVKDGDIYYAITENPGDSPLSMKQYGDAPVISKGGSGEWDEASVAAGSVIYENGMYKMWYRGSTGTNNRIGFATSTDGFSWTRYAGNPVYDDTNIDYEGNPAVVHDSEGYKMYYTAPYAVGVTYPIRLATSNDGVNWSKYSDTPVLSSGSDYWEAMRLSVQTVMWGDPQPITGPFISHISSLAVNCGTEVTIKGIGFGANPGSVSFVGETLSIQSWWDTEIVVTTPTSANSGLVTVETSMGTTSNSCTMTVECDCIPPSITFQPQDQVIEYNTFTTLSVEAAGSESLTYQWYQGESGDTSTPVGEDSPGFTTPALTVTTNYWVKVSNDCGIIDSNAATITVNPPAIPEIKISHKNVEIPDGGSFIFENTEETLTIENTGTANLILSLPIVITGADADQFSIVQQPSSSIVPGSSTALVISFNPTSGGEKTASISIGNNDPDENPYDITTIGTGVDPETLVVEPTTWVAPAGGGTSPPINVSVEGAVGPVSYTVSKEADWLEVSSAGGTAPGTFTITALPNTPGETKEAFVTVMADVTNGSPSTVKVIQRRISLDINSGTLNNAPLDVTLPEITVEKDQPIQGTVSLSASNYYPCSSCIMPFAWTPGWGNHQGAYQQISGWVPWQQTVEYDVNIDIDAPAATGTYYLWFVMGARYNSAEMMSCDRPQVWDDSDDIADMGETKYQEAVSTGGVDWTFNDQPHFHEAVRAIKVIVIESSPEILSLSPDSGPVGTEVTISGATFGAIQGNVTFSGVDASINSWTETQIVAVVPTAAVTGDVVVHSADGKDSNGVTFTVIVPVFPEINIIDVPDGGSIDFCNVEISFSSDITLTIENTGNADLTLNLPLVINGENADQFSIVQQPVSPVAPGGTTTLTIRFTPTTIGAKTASISIGNNDPDENPYYITMIGTGVDPGTLVVEPTTWVAPAGGGTSPPINVSVEGAVGPVSYTVSKEADWLEVSSAGGTAPGTFAISAPPNTPGETKEAFVTVMANVANGSPQTVKVIQRRISLDINSGTINNAPLDSALPEVTVEKGQPIQGTVSLSASNYYPCSSCIMPFAWTPGWGNHQGSYQQISGWVPWQQTVEYDVNIDIDAPAETGMYYLWFVMGARYNSAEMMSCDRPQVWDDSDDIADMGETQYQEAVSTGGVDWTFNDQPHFHEAVRAIKVIVIESSPEILSLSPGSGPVGTEVTISGSNFGAPQGTVTFNAVNASINSWTETQIAAVVPTGAVTGDVVVHSADGKDSNGVTFTVTVPVFPEINIIDVPDGGSIDFGDAAVGFSVNMTLTIENTGTAELTLNDLPIEVTGTNEDQFSILQQPLSTVAPGENTTLTICFIPTTVGAKTAALSIANNDADENPYDITLVGSGIESSFWAVPDFNRDGQADVLWRYQGPEGYNVVWLLGTNGSAAAAVQDQSNEVGLVYQYMYSVSPAGNRIETGTMGLKAFPPFKKDGFEDVNDWENAPVAFERFSIDAYQWLSDFSRVMSSSVPDPRDDPQAVELPAVADQNWKLAGTGDFNRDGKVDIVWSHVGDGHNCVWYMDGTILAGYGQLPDGANTDWVLAGVGDFNQDSKPDLLWRNEADGRNAIWYMDGTTLLSIGIMTTGANLDWKLCGTGDFNGDNKVDLVWRNTSDGRNAVWYMDGVELSSVGWLDPVEDQNWKLRGTGDFNGDGKTDLIWTDISDGRNCIWYLDGVTWFEVEFLPTVTDTDWKIEN